jgi:hypothetical protein
MLSEQMRLVKVGSSVAEKLERQVAEMHHKIVIARLKHFREQLEREMQPDSWLELEASMPVLLSDICQALGLLPQERAEVLGQTGYAAVEGVLDRRIVPTTRVRNDRQAMALKYAQKHGRITLADYRRVCPYWSDETLRLDLVGLVKRGLLNKCGSGRGTSYVLSECE